MTAVIEERRGRTAVLKLNNPPVNGLGWPVREGLDAAIDRLRGDGDVDAIVVTGDGRMFCAGADIREFGTTPPEHVRILPDILLDLEALDKPVVEYKFVYRTPTLIIRQPMRFELKDIDLP